MLLVQPTKALLQSWSGGKISAECAQESLHSIFRSKEQLFVRFKLTNHVFLDGGNTFEDGFWLEIQTKTKQW